MEISNEENPPAGAYSLSRGADISRPTIGGLDNQSNANRGSEMSNVNEFQFGQPKMVAPQVKRPDGLNRQDVDDSSDGGAISTDGGNTTRQSDTSTANVNYIKIDRKARKRSKPSGDSPHEARKLEAKLNQCLLRVDTMEKENRQLREELAICKEALKKNNIDIVADNAMEVTENWSAEVAKNLGTACGMNVAPPATIEGERMEEMPSTSRGAIPKTTRKTANTSDVQNANRQGRTGGENRRKGKVSPPIIKIYNINVRELTRKLKGFLGHELFNMKLINSKMVELKLAKIEDHSKVRSFLENENLSHYTYTPSDAKPYTLMVKGLSGTYEESDLREFINEKQKDLVIKSIVKLEGDRWIVRLDGGSDVQSFRRLEYLLNNKVSIEDHKRTGLLQCRNCQRFGHVSTNCRMGYRCVKCGQSHGPQKCEIPPKGKENEEILTRDPDTGKVIKVPKRPVHCINCKTDGHVASAKNCPKRIKILEKIEENKKASAKSNDKNNEIVTTATEIRNPIPMVKSTISYSNAARMANRTPVATTPSAAGAMEQANAAMGMFDSECKRLLGKDFLTCLTKIGDFAAKYRELDTDDKRTNALFGLLLSMKLYD